MLQEGALFYLANVVCNLPPVFRHACGRSDGRGNVTAISKPNGTDRRFMSDKIMTTGRCEQAQTCVCVCVWDGGEGG